MKTSTTSGYQPFDTDHEEANNESILIRVVPENKSRWNHIEDLDAFFSRVYHYHQQHGFACMMLQEFLELVQFAFICVLTTYVIQCIDYSVLFRNNPRFANETVKVTIGDVLYGPGQCISNLHIIVTFLLLIAFIFWVLRIIAAVYHLFQYWEMRSFYKTALHINDEDLENFTWYEVQQRLKMAQKDFQMCIHKQELTDLDIYHRILRFENYLVAMVNKSVLPLKHNFPFVGERMFLTKGLKYNIQYLLFWGPGAPFDNSWHLRDDYKRPSKRRELAKQLESRIRMIGVVNFFFSPFILVWQILYAFFSYVELLKREPGAFGARRWSPYGKLYLRHFNELDHELQTRLSRAYRSADHYLSGFTSSIWTVLAKNLQFLAGSLLAVLVILTVWDEDVLAVEHLLTMGSVLGGIVAGCVRVIPGENFVWCPENLMESVLANVHYLPLEWKGKAHTKRVREEFLQLFQYTATNIGDELLSPILTPFILFGPLRSKALEIVDFLRHFTVDVVGVGDVCSFAQLDLHRHGQPQWQSSIQTESSTSIQSCVDPHFSAQELYEKAEDGKTELSLIHFALTNPEWRPPPVAENFLSALRSQIQNEFSSSPLIHQPSMLVSSTVSGEVSVCASTLRSLLNLGSPMLLNQPQEKSYPLIGYGVARTAGPRILPENRSFLGSDGSGSTPILHEGTVTLEPTAVNMAVSAMFLHERRGLQQRRNLGTSHLMPGIRECPDEETHQNPAAVAAAALASVAAAAVEHVPLVKRMSKSN